MDVGVATWSLVAAHRGGTQKTCTMEGSPSFIHALLVSMPFNNTVQVGILADVVAGRPILGSWFVHLVFGV